MNHPPQYHTVSLEIPATLLAKIARVTNNLETAVLEGLKLWYVREIERQLHRFYTTQPASDRDFETEWLTLIEKQISETWNNHEF